MPFELERHPDLIEIRFVGEVSIEDLQELARRCDQVDLGTVTLPCLADATGISGIRLLYGELVCLAASRWRRGRPGRVRTTAIVVDSDLAYGVARMYDAVLDDPQCRRQIFWDREAALRWLMGRARSGAGAEGGASQADNNESLVVPTPQASLELSARTLRNRPNGVPSIGQERDGR